MSLINYAIGIAKNLDIEEANWRAYESILLQCMHVEPSVISTVARELFKYASQDYNLDAHLISQCLHQHEMRHLPLGHTHEVVWSIWLLAALEYSIHDDLVSRVSSSMDPLLLSLLFSLDQHGLLTSKVDRKIITSILKDPEWEKSEYAMFLYHADIDGWATRGKSGYVQDSALFAQLAQNGARFLEPRFSISTDAPEATDWYSDDMSILDRPDDDDDDIPF